MPYRRFTVLVLLLVFHHFGDRFFLAQVWEQGSNIHRDVPSSKLERELAKNGERIQLLAL